MPKLGLVGMRSLPWTPSPLQSAPSSKTMFDNYGLSRGPDWEINSALHSSLLVAGQKLLAVA